MSFLRLLPDNFWDWWKCCFNSLRSVNRSSGVKTWQFYFYFWAAARAKSFELFWLSHCESWLIPSVRSSVPGRRYIGCIDSEVTFHCDMVCFPTSLTGWANSFWLFTGPLMFLYLLLLLLLLVLLFGIELLAPMFFSRIILRVLCLFF